MPRTTEVSNAKVIRSIMGALFLAIVWGYIIVPFFLARMPLYLFLTVFFVIPSASIAIIASHLANIKVGQRPTNLKICASEIWWERFYGFILMLSFASAILAAYIIIGG